MLRRHLIRQGLLLLIAIAMPMAIARAQAPTANDPAAIITAIYTRATAGEGNSGGDFLTMGKSAKAKYFSKSLLALWAKADAKTLKGYEGPRPKPADMVVRYDFVRDGGHWKIDEIRGAIDGTPWSLRAMLQEPLKS